MSLNSKFEGNEGFLASNGRLGRWNKIHGVTFVIICGDKMSADAPASSEFVTKLENTVQYERKPLSLIKYIPNVAMRLG